MMRFFNWKTTLIIYAAVVLLPIGACSNQDATSARVSATRTAEEGLTNTYGIEVSRVIENFETSWFTLAAHRNPNIQSELATGPYLDYFGFSRAGDALEAEPYWLAVRSATIKDLRVVEYTSARFKAVACLDILDDKRTVEGELIEILPMREECRVYVFINAESSWKLATAFNTSAPDDVVRDWDQAPA
jgi:hypothetical protein